MFTQSTKPWCCGADSVIRMAVLVFAIIILAASCASSYDEWLDEDQATTGAANQAPKAQLGVYPSSGVAPLLVQHDATGCWDIDGTISSYDWDFDGDGAFDVTGGEALPPEYTYDEAGTFNATVRVTDDEGATASATATVTVTGAPAGNNPPVAQFTASPSVGTAPLSVSFDATDSHDPDGEIASIDWDCTGDGSYDPQPSGPQPGEITYDEAGVYHIRMRVTDDQGLTSVASTEIVVTADDAPPADQVPELTIAKWPGGADAALSLTFDDGTPDHWSRGLPLWEEYGFRVTLGITAQTFNGAPERLADLQQAFDAGHELANHSNTHTDFTELSETTRRNEVLTCQQLLLANVDGLDRVYTFIYPYENYNQDILDLMREMGFLFARSGAQGISEYAMVNDAWNPPLLQLYSWANQAELEMWMWDSIVDAVVEDGGWQIEQCHGIGEPGEDGVGWSARPEAEYRAHYDHIASFGDRLWVAPVGEVGRYILERNSTEFVVLDYTDDSLSFIATDGLDNEIYSVPLTVMLELPEGWNAAQVHQGSAVLDVAAPSAEHVVFEVIPGGGIVSVSQG
jgi:PKD repeat protein